MHQLVRIHANYDCDYDDDDDDDDDDDVYYYGRLYIISKLKET